MIRTQVQLTEEQAKALKRRAAEEDVSIAEVIRQAVDRLLADEDREAARQRMIEAVQRGGHRSGHSDVAEEHDRHLAEIYGEHLRR